MKKCLLTFLLFALTPMMSFGAAGAVGQTEQQQLNLMQDSALIDAIVKRLAKSFPEHHEELSQMFSDKLKEYDAAESYGERIQGGFVKFAELMAQKVYKEILTEEIEKIKQRSQQTGRKIKTDPDGINLDSLANVKLSKGDEAIEIWLDGGNMDSNNCIPNESNCTDKNETFDCYANEAKKFCLYPDNFESHRIYIDENEVRRTMDDRAKNETSVIDIIMMHGRSSDGRTSNTGVFLDVSSLMYDYDEFADSRNRHQQALRNGAFLFATYCAWYGDKDPKCKDIINTKFMDFYPNGDSSCPAYRVVSGLYDINEFRSKSQKIKSSRFPLETQKLLEHNGVKFDENGSIMNNTNKNK